MKAPKARTAVSVLTLEDWHFDDVPDRELNPCLLYEFSRESELVRGFVKRWQNWKKQAKTWNREHGIDRPNVAGDAEQRDIRRAVLSLKLVPSFGYNPRGWEHLICCWGWVGKLPPWQSLTTEQRAYWSMGLCYKAAVKMGFERDLWEIQNALKAKPSASVALPEAIARSEDGRVRVVLVFDFTYSDKAIAEDVKRVIAKLRPSDIVGTVGPRRGGRNTGSLGKLHDPGRARLSANLTAKQLKTTNSEAWEWLGGSQNEENLTTDLRAVSDALVGGKSRFAKSFKEIFPDHGEPCLKADGPEKLT